MEWRLDDQNLFPLTLGRIHPEGNVSPSEASEQRGNVSRNIASGRNIVAKYPVPTVEAER